MSNEELFKKGEAAQQRPKRAVHDELVKKAKLGKSVTINRGGKPYKITAPEALRVQEEGEKSGSDSETRLRTLFLCLLCLFVAKVPLLFCGRSSRVEIMRTIRIKKRELKS